MFGIDSSELAVVALVALLVIGPKDLPRVMRMVGTWVAKGRAMSRHVRAGFDTMMREAELEEMQKAWAAQNDAIMKATSVANPFTETLTLPAQTPPAPAHVVPPPGDVDHSDTPWMLPPPADAAPAATTPASEAPAKPARKPRAKADPAAATRRPRKAPAKPDAPGPDVGTDQ